MIKTRLLIFALGVITLFNSCTETLEPLFFVTVDRDFVIPGNLNTIETHFFELKNVPTLLEENLTVFNRTLDDVTSINPGDASFTVNFDNVDWTFIQKVEVYVVSRTDPNNKIRMFFSNEPDFNNRSSLNMFNSFVDIKDIMKEGIIDLEVRIKTRTFVPGNVATRLTFNYGVFDEL